MQSAKCFDYANEASDAAVDRITNIINLNTDSRQKRKDNFWRLWNEGFSMINKYMLFSIAVCTALPCAGENIPGSLCGNQEKVYASCTLKNNKIVSFCGVPASDKNKGMVLVQYRYGLPEKIELKYPEEAMSPGCFF